MERALPPQETNRQSLKPRLSEFSTLTPKTETNLPRRPTRGPLTKPKTSLEDRLRQ